MNETKLTLSILPLKLAVCRLDKESAIPDWATENSSFFAITRTNDELSIVCSEEVVPDEIRAEKGWRSFKVEGPLDFSLTGILSSLTAPLAEEKISIFAISTYDTDYVLVKDNDIDRAKEVLSECCNIIS